MPSRATLRHRAYRFVLKNWIEKHILPRFLSKEKLELFKESQRQWKVVTAPSSKRPRAWFHAASVGELESLWPVIETWGKKYGDVIITIFSESALKSLERLKAHLKDERIQVSFAGFAPWEGDWTQALKRARPHVFVTAMYEAWPDLWLSLGQLDIPLVVIGAKDRKSIRVAKRVCLGLGGQMPKMALLTADSADEDLLKLMFQDAIVSNSGDPRWDRVKTRTGKSHPRLSSLLKKLTGHIFPKPWGVLGSIELADLEIWGSLLTKTKGSIWVVPHRVEEDHLEPILKWFEGMQIPYVRSSEGVPNKKSHLILVDEIGFLAELYSHVDWAYIGGGFGENLHSTLEPAIFGIPISGGSKGSMRAPETRVLRESGQLMILNHSRELEQWLETVNQVPQRKKDEWSGHVAREMGATDRVFAHIQKVLS